MALWPYMTKFMPNCLSGKINAKSLVVAIAYDQLCTFEFGIAVEVFGLSRPEMGPDWYRFAVAGADDGQMRAAGGFRFEVDGGLELLSQADTVIVPGWRGIDAPVPSRLSEALKAARVRGARILSFCSGVFVLAATGLLAGKRATTHWRYANKLMADTRLPNFFVVSETKFVAERDGFEPSVRTAIPRSRHPRITENPQ
jgi:AraC family transcriptional activator FtrA